MTKALKCVRDIRDIPPATYRLPDDGRQQRHLCEQRQRLAWLLATFADGDGKRIRPSVQTLADALGKSRRAVTYLLDDLQKLGLLENGKLAGFKGTRWRALNVNALAQKTVAQSSADAQSSAPTVAQPSEDRCAIYAPTDAQSTRVEDCVTGEDCAEPSFSDRPKQQTDPQTGKLPTWVGRLFFDHNQETVQLRKIDRDQFMAAIKQHGEITVAAAWREFVKTGRYNAETMFPASVFFRDGAADLYIQDAIRKLKIERERNDPARISAIEASVQRQKEEHWERMTKTPPPENGGDPLEYLTELDARQEKREDAINKASGDRFADNYAINGGAVAIGTVEAAVDEFLATN